MPKKEMFPDYRKLKQHKLKQQFLEALEKTLGIVSHAAEIVGISRRTHYHWMKDDLEYKEAVEDIAYRTIDVAEHELLKQIKAGNTTALIFFLKCKAKGRGYVEKQVTEIQQAPVKLYGTEEIIDEV